MKNTILKIKKSPDGLKNKLDISEEKISDPESKAITIIETEIKQERKKEG